MNTDKIQIIKTISHGSLCGELITNLVDNEQYNLAPSLLANKDSITSDEPEHLNIFDFNNDRYVLISNTIDSQINYFNYQLKASLQFVNEQINIQNNLKKILDNLYTIKNIDSPHYNQNRTQQYQPETQNQDQQPTINKIVSKSIVTKFPPKYWSEIEDSELLKLRNTSSLTWGSIGKQLGRTGKSCSYRY